MILIDYTKIKYNIKNIKKTNDLMIVVKNDAYGFGLKRIFDIAYSEGVRDFAVNDIKEAIKLRLLSNDINILLFSPLYNNINYLKTYNIIPTVENINDINYCIDKKLYCAIKLNVGMNRFGINQLDNNLVNNNYIKYIYAHFPKYDINTNNIINTISNNYKKKCYYGGSILYPHTNLPLRVGGAIYKDSLSFYGKILSIKKLSKGERLGYDYYYEALFDHYYAILDVGYVNGLSRSFNGCVYYKNKFYNVIGLVCMNHTFIFSDDIMKIGDYVEFFGNNIKIDKFLEQNNMTLYEFYLKNK